MKRFCVLSLVLLLAACAGVSPQRQSECTQIAHVIATNDAWNKVCQTNDAAYLEGWEQAARKAPPEPLCNGFMDNPQPHMKQILSNVIQEKGIDCKPYVAARVVGIVNSMSVADLCHAWGNGNYPADVTQIIRDTVNKQGLNCPSVMAATAQQQQAAAQNMQAIAQQQQALAQEQQARAQQAQIRALQYQQQMPTETSNV